MFLVGRDGCVWTEESAWPRWAMGAEQHCGPAFRACRHARAPAEDLFDCVRVGFLCELLSSVYVPVTDVLLNACEQAAKARLLS